MEMTGAVLALIGSIIFFLSALGLIRMPDLYNRIQTGTKATTLGTIILSIGLCLIHPEWTGKLVILILFIVLTNPISSHVVARGAHYSGQEMTDKTVGDALTEEDKDKEGTP
ncbi:MAG: monovalent cation/H(+) antiporter subunit G [Spirochaetales bacterium]|nr:monovalent cation/H(+) antiporter subunit G [Spirochaetales bacterium]